MDKTVIFDAADFRDVYPDMAGTLTDTQLQFVFEEAELFVDNTPGSVVPMRPQNIRKRLLYYAMAYFLSLQERGMDAVGAVASTSQGSVSVSFAQVAGRDDAGFWGQNNYGLRFWKASQPYRLGPVYALPKTGRGGPCR